MFIPLYMSCKQMPSYYKDSGTLNLSFSFSSCDLCWPDPHFSLKSGTYITTDSKVKIKPTLPIDTLNVYVYIIECLHMRIALSSWQKKWVNIANKNRSWILIWLLSFIWVYFYSCVKWLYVSVYFKFTVLRNLSRTSNDKSTASWDSQNLLHVAICQKLWITCKY